MDPRPSRARSLGVRHPARGHRRRERALGCAPPAHHHSTGRRAAGEFLLPAAARLPRTRQAPQRRLGARPSGPTIDVQRRGQGLHCNAGSGSAVLSPGVEPSARKSPPELYPRERSGDGCLIDLTTPKMNPTIARAGPPAKNAVMTASTLSSWRLLENEVTRTQQTTTPRMYPRMAHRTPENV